MLCGLTATPCMALVNFGVVRQPDFMHSMRICTCQYGTAPIQLQQTVMVEKVTQVADKRD